MEIIILIIVLLVAGFVIKKYTTKCPSCGTVGQYRNLHKHHIGKDASRYWTRRDDGKRRERELYNERYQCVKCEHEFSRHAAVTHREA
jgi:hypothetical protein